MNTGRAPFPFLLLLTIAQTIALGACNGSGSSAAGDAATPEVESEYFPATQLSGERRDSEALEFHVDTVVDGLDIPWSMAFLPAGRVLITERGGSLRIVENAELRQESISGVPAVRAQGQGGLLDVAAHPDFPDNGWIYLSYAEPTADGTHTALMRARLDLENYRLLDRQVLFSGLPKTDATHHFGGRIVLRDGYVFLSTGDRGVMDEAQNLASHNGAVIRLHDDGRVPTDNPFLDEPGALPEIWSYGHRNTQGLSVHPQAGEIWNNEHGPRGGDEINIVRAGRNYGWPEITYGINYDGTPITDQTEMEGMEQPVTYWVPSIAPSGLAFVSGSRYPGWEGNIMTGALAGQELRRVELNGETVVHQESLLLGEGRIRDVRMAPDGYLYFANESNGTINRIVPLAE